MTAGDVLVDEPVQADLQDSNFLMYSYKVKPCQKKYRHDWRVCPFAHEGESAARRDPRRYKYVGVACPYAKQGKSCPRGQSCPCTHNVFEYWLHPTRFRTEICSQGTKCNRSCCFFAHTDSELRKLKHQDIINSAVGDPNETCDALESYLKKTSTLELNDVDNDSDSRDSVDDAVIIMGSVPKTEDDVSSDGEDEGLVMGMAPQADVLRNSPEQVAVRYSPGAVRMMSPQDHSSYHPSVQVSRATEWDGSYFDGSGAHHQYCQNGVTLRNSPDTLLVQDIYMTSPEPAVVMGRDGQAHLVSMGDPALKVQEHPRAPLNPYSSSGALNPYVGHLSAGMQLNGFHQTGQQMGRRSPPQSPTLLHRGLVHEDNLVNLANDYSQLSRSWKLNRGVSFPSVVRREGQLGGGMNLPANSTVQMGGNATEHLNGGATLDDELSLQDEFQRLSASWGINRGATLPSLHPTTRSYPHIQNELQHLSDTWGVKRDDFNSTSFASLKNIHGLRDVSTNGLNTFNSLDKFTGYQKDCHFDGLGALRQEPYLNGYQGHLSPPPGDMVHGSVSPAEFSNMAASWGLGRNESSLSDSFALGGQEHLAVGDRSGLSPGLSGPPPGFGPGRTSFELPENAPVSDLSFLGSEGVGAYMPAGRVVGRNWTFGGNGRVA